MRFRSAYRATLSGALTGTLLDFLVVHRVIPAGAAAIGLALSIMGVVFPRAPSPGQRASTIGCMALGDFASATVATLLAIWPYLSDLGFLALLFMVVALQTRGPRFVATGILSVSSAYLALFLRLTPAQAPTALLALALAASIVLFVGFVLPPERSGDALQRLIRALERRATPASCSRVGQKRRRPGTAPGPPVVPPGSSRRSCQQKNGWPLSLRLPCPGSGRSSRASNSLWPMSPLQRPQRSLSRIQKRPVFGWRRCGSIRAGEHACGLELGPGTPRCEPRWRRSKSSPGFVSISHRTFAGRCSRLVGITTA
jgi:hypothetical protein